VSQHEVAFLQDALEGLSRTVWSGLQEAIACGDHETFRGARQAVEVTAGPGGGGPAFGKAEYYKAAESPAGTATTVGDR
jgi:hypothetical protein